LRDTIGSGGLLGRLGGGHGQRGAAPASGAGGKGGVWRCGVNGSGGAAATGVMEVRWRRRRGWACRRPAEAGVWLRDLRLGVEVVAVVIFRW
jgi:hypothetical protein